MFLGAAVWIRDVIRSEPKVGAVERVRQILRGMARQPQAAKIAGFEASQGSRDTDFGMFYQVPFIGQRPSKADIALGAGLAVGQRFVPQIKLREELDEPVTELIYTDAAHAVIFIPTSDHGGRDDDDRGREKDEVTGDDPSAGVEGSMIIVTAAALKNAVAHAMQSVLICRGTFYDIDSNGYFDKADVDKVTGVSALVRDSGEATAPSGTLPTFGASISPSSDRWRDEEKRGHDHGSKVDLVAASAYEIGLIAGVEGLLAMGGFFLSEYAPDYVLNSFVMANKLYPQFGVLPRGQCGSCWAFS